MREQVNDDKENAVDKAIDQVAGKQRVDMGAVASVLDGE